MNRALIGLLPGLICLSACQVGIGYGPMPSPSSSASPSDLPTVAPTTLPTTSPTAAPTGLPPAPSPTPSAQQPVSFAELLDRDTASEDEEQTRAISDQASFAQFWAEHNDPQRGGPAQPMPTIDFNENTVVSVYKQEAGYSGLGYEIVSVSQANRVVTVHYRQRTQQPGLVYLPVISNTVHAVSIPLSQADGDFDNILFVEDPPQPSGAS